MKKAIYAGSFDPVTLGHLDIIQQASSLFDEVYVAIAHNTAKKPLFSKEDRIQLLEEAAKERGLENVRVVAFNGLTVQFAKEIEAATIVRGLRAISDFDSEFQMALMNRKMNPEINTIFLMASEENFYLSSHIVKEVAGLGGDVSEFVPPVVEKALTQKIKRS